MKVLWRDYSRLACEVGDRPSQIPHGTFIAIVRVTGLNTWGKNYELTSDIEAFIKCKSKKEAKAALKKLEDA